MSSRLPTAAFDPAYRPARIRFQKVCIVLALATFLVSLALPAARLPTGDDGLGALPVPGVTCALMSKAHYPSNLLLLAAPLTCWALRRSRRPALPRAVAALAACSLAFVAATPLLPLPARLPTGLGAGLALDVGFPVWVAAHLLVTAALAVPVWGTDAEAERLRQEFEALQRRWAPAAPAPAAAR